MIPMAVPWLRLIDMALGVTNLAQARMARPNAPPDELAAGSPALGHLETRLAGVVVAALKEAFDRDSKRLDFEREQIEAERQRVERALKLELIRQAGDREIGRLRLIAAVAVASWIGTLFFARGLMAGPAGARIALGAGWALLLAALAAAFAAQSAVGDALAVIDETGHRPGAVSSGVAGALAPWLTLIGLALAGLALLIV
jgi:hypothetical protein